MTDTKKKPSAELKTLAARINADRLRRRMTWPVYARHMDVKQSTLYKIAMLSTTRPHALTLEQIKRKLKRTPEQADATGHDGSASQTTD